MCKGRGGRGCWKSVEGYILAIREKKLITNIIRYLVAVLDHYRAARLVEVPFKIRSTHERRSIRFQLPISTYDVLHGTCVQISKRNQENYLRPRLVF